MDGRSFLLLFLGRRLEPRVHEHHTIIHQLEVCGQLREVSVKNLHELRYTHRFNLNNKLLLRLITNLTRLNDQIATGS